MPRAETPAPERGGLEGTVTVPRDEPPPPGEPVPREPPAPPPPEPPAEAAPPVASPPEPAAADITAEALPAPAEPPPAEPVQPVPASPDEPQPGHLPAAFAADPPERIHRPVPVFPRWADIDEILGSHAVFRVDIDEGGNVLHAELLETTAEDNVEPAREALLESRYRPVRSPAGVPVRATIVERIEF